MDKYLEKSGEERAASRRHAPLHIARSAAHLYVKPGRHTRDLMKNLPL